jgi:predicted transcriptional regulator
MAQKNFILMSLEDKETKKIANVVSNDSCKKILDYLAEKDKAIESDIAKELNIPISTAHYNLKQLMEVGLVISDEFHYSSKGKEVRHYTLANKYIIITPNKVNNIKDIIKNIMPAFIISTIFSTILYLASRFSINQDSSFARSVAEPEMLAYDSNMPSLAMKSVDSGMGLSSEGSSAFYNNLFYDPNIAVWFLSGAIFTTCIYVIIRWIKKNK